MKQKHITGTMRYMDVATGFWCLVDKRYQKWRLINPPAALQQEGLFVEALVEKAEEGASIFMSGKPVKVISFEVKG